MDVKVEGVTKFPIPTSRQELMCFLGMAGYYRKFCKSFLLVAEPLTCIFRKNQKFEWSTKCSEAFKRIKSLLMSAPVLVTPQFDKPFVLMVDASDLGVGAVLMQEDHHGVEHPIAYFSQKFNKSQQNYCTSEKEIWHLYKLSNTSIFTYQLLLIFTDHNPLTFLNRLRDKIQRLMRWSLILQGYDLIIKHIPGKHNVLADALSRGL